MGANVFSGVLTIAAVLVAVWLDLRLGERRPASPLRRVAHAFVAVAVLQAASVGFAYVLRSRMPLGQQMLTLFLLYLPSLIYAFLSGVWLMRTLVEVARLARR